MSTHAESSQEKTHTHIATGLSQQKKGNKALPLTDYRPSSLAQKELQEKINNRSQVKQLKIGNVTKKEKSYVTQPTIAGNMVVQRVHGSFVNANYANARATVLGANGLHVEGEMRHHSEILRASLTGEGDVPDSNLEDQIGNQAHHIVEAGAAVAAPARMLLATAGIHIDSSINGVLLPSEQSDDGGDAALHIGSHRAEYAAAVNDSLANAILNNPPLGGWPLAMGVAATVPNICAAVAGVPALAHFRTVLVNRLVAIRHVLLEGAAALNNRGDGEYNPANEEEVTFSSVFAAHGIA